MTQHEPAPCRPYRAAHDVDWSALDRLGIIHVGQSSALVGTSGRSDLLPVTWGDRGLAPGGFALEAVDGLRFRRRLLDRQRDHSRVDLRAWQRVPAGRCVVTDLRVPPLRIDPEATYRVGQLLGGASRRWSDATMDPSPQRALAPTLAAAIVDGDAPRAGAVARDLIGSGPGATPAGDDIIVGVLAALQLAAAQGPLQACGTREARRILEAAVADGLLRTTAVSRHQLSAALRGSFAERYLHMSRAIADVTSVEPAYGSALGWGATSGIDFLHGLVATAQSVLRRGAAGLPATA